MWPVSHFNCFLHKNCGSALPLRSNNQEQVRINL